MTPFPWTDLIIIAGLIVLNGVFAMSELAIVSAKTNTLKARRDDGSKAAALFERGGGSVRRGAVPSEAGVLGALVRRGSLRASLHGCSEPGAGSR